MRPWIAPPPLLDGAKVLATADLSNAGATGTVRHFSDGELQDSNRFAYLALAAYEGETGCYVFYCDERWEVQNDLLYDSRKDEEEGVHREFDDVQFIDV